MRCPFPRRLKPTPGPDDDNLKNVECCPLWGRPPSFIQRRRILISYLDFSSFSPFSAFDFSNFSSLLIKKKELELQFCLIGFLSVFYLASIIRAWQFRGLMNTEDSGKRIQYTRRRRERERRPIVAAKKPLLAWSSILSPFVQISKNYYLPSFDKRIGGAAGQTKESGQNLQAPTQSSLARGVSHHDDDDDDFN